MPLPDRARKGRPTLAKGRKEVGCTGNWQLFSWLFFLTGLNLHVWFSSLLVFGEHARFTRNEFLLATI